MNEKKEVIHFLVEPKGTGLYKTTKSMGGTIIQSFRKLKKQDNIETIHCHSSLFSNELFKVSKWAKQKGYRLIYSPHGCFSAYNFIVPKMFRNIYDIRIKEYIEQFKPEIVTFTNFEKQIIQDKQVVKDNNIKVRTHKLKFELKLNKPNPNKKLRFLTVGRFSKQRTPIGFVKALIHKAEVGDFQGKEWEYIIVGSSKKNTLFEFGDVIKKCKRVVRKSKFKDHFKFIAETKNPEKYYRKCSIFLYNSEFESLSRPIIDAIRFGLQIISTKVGILNDIGTHNNFHDINNYEEDFGYLWDYTRVPEKEKYNLYICGKRNGEHKKEMVDNMTESFKKWCQE